MKNVDDKKKIVSASETPRRSSRPKTRQIRPRNKAARWMMAGVSLVLVAATVLVLLNLRPIGGEVLDVFFNTPRHLRGKTRNVLICSMDAEDGSMINVLMLASIDLERGQMNILQIPGETYVGEGVVYTGKINAVYNWGYKAPQESNEEPGINALAKLINSQFKLPVDNYLLITVEGLCAAVEAVGGIEVTPPALLEINIGGTELLRYEAGKTYHLDGRQAGVLLRFRGEFDTRYARTADVGGMGVQRLLFAALMEKVLELPASKLLSMAGGLSAEMEADLTVNEAISLLRGIRNLDMGAVAFWYLPGEPIAAYGFYGLDVYTVHQRETADLLNRYMRPYGEPVSASDLNSIELAHQTFWYREDMDLIHYE